MVLQFHPSNQPQPGKPFGEQVTTAQAQLGQQAWTRLVIKFHTLDTQSNSRIESKQLSIPVRFASMCARGTWLAGRC